MNRHEGKPQFDLHSGIFGEMLHSVNMEKPIQVIGLMSGTSLDGVDLAACTFSLKDECWQFSIDAAETIPYSSDWSNKLQTLHLASAEELAETHSALGRYFGALIADFCQTYTLNPALVGSHGHTIFHQPQRKFTLQIGDGAAIAAISGIDTVCDFRTKDIALGGQGAPLVPVGDAMLFSEYAGCLNLGGISNISFGKGNIRNAWDICPVNMILNHLALYEGKAFDDGGQLAASGKILPTLLEELNSLPFYHQAGPRSLGREWFEKIFLPLIKNSEGATLDKMRTAVEHIAIKIGEAINGINEKGPVLVTGGGAFNRFLIERMRFYSSHPVTIPSTELINFKEAIVFALLAALNINGKENVFSSATGASRNSIGGALYRAN